MEWEEGFGRDNTFDLDIDKPKSKLRNMNNIEEWCGEHANFSNDDPLASFTLLHTKFGRMLMWNKTFLNNKVLLETWYGST